MTVDHLVLLRQMTHADMPPNTASRTSEMIVTSVEEPNACQKTKFLLLITELALETNCLKLAPAVEIGLETMALCVLKELRTTRAKGKRI